MRISRTYRQLPRNEKLAVLASAHLLGAGGAKELLNGVDGADAFGTKGSTYVEKVRLALRG